MKINSLLLTYVSLRTHLKQKKMKSLTTARIVGVTHSLNK